MSRQELVETLLTGAETRIGSRLDEGFRAGLKARLTALPDAAWKELERTRDLSSVKGPLGGPVASDRLVYRTVPPCRILDTRVAGGSLAVGTPRPFKVTGANLDFQGGNAAGCGVPPGFAVGAIINFVAVNPVGAGNLRAWAFGDPIPLASILNYASVPGLNIANGIAIPICDQDPNPSACTLDFNVQADGSGTNLVADVVGYFEKYQPAVLFTTTGATGTSVPVQQACTFITGNQITVSLPGPGKVLVQAQPRGRFVNPQKVKTYVGDQQADCSHEEGAFYAEYPPGVTAAFDFAAPTWAVFDVPAAGPRTYYLNAIKLVATGQVVNIEPQAKFTVVFLPN